MTRRLPPVILQNVSALLSAPDFKTFARCGRACRTACESPWVKAVWLSRYRPTRALMCACSTGSVDVVKHTLHIMNADAAQCQFNTIHNTLSCDGTPIGFAISRGYTPLEFAISRGYTSIVEELLRTGIRVDMRHGGNALITAVEKGRSDFVKMLLEAPSVDACADADTVRQFKFETPTWTAYF